MSLNPDHFFYLEDLDCPELDSYTNYKKLVEHIADLAVKVAEVQEIDKAWLWILPDSFK